MLINKLLFGLSLCFLVLVNLLELSSVAFISVNRYMTAYRNDKLLESILLTFPKI